MHPRQIKFQLQREYDYERMSNVDLGVPNGVPCNSVMCVFMVLKERKKKQGTIVQFKLTKQNRTQSTQV